MASEQKTVESEVSSLLWHKHELEVCKRELETYKSLYWELQIELDRVDDMRKRDPYIALMRQRAKEKHIAQYKRTHSDKEEIRSNSEPDVGCDCVGETTVSSEPNPHKAPYWELQDEMDKVESMLSLIHI